MRIPTFLLLLGLSVPCTLLSQTPVPVGSGSYASSFPPGSSVEGVINTTTLSNTIESWTRRITPEFGTGPTPTHEWWSSLMSYKFNSKSSAPGDYFVAWAIPLATYMDVTGKGMLFCYPHYWSSTANLTWNNGIAPGGTFDIFMGSAPGQPLVPPWDYGSGIYNWIRLTASNFTATNTKVGKHSDWLCDFRMEESPNRYIDCTMGSGLPYIWVQPHNTTCAIVFSGTAPTTTISNFDANGTKIILTGPRTNTMLGFQHSISTPSATTYYALFAPTGTIFRTSGRTNKITLPPGSQYFVIAALPDRQSATITAFMTHAFAKPVDSQFTYNYSPSAGKVSAQWTITTSPLQGTENRVIQGLLPIHYSLPEGAGGFNGFEYVTARGTMKCITGNSFSAQYPFTGIIPVLPAPQENASLPNPYSKALFTNFAKGRWYGMQPSNQEGIDRRRGGLYFDTAVFYPHNDSSFSTTLVDNANTYGKGVEAFGWSQLMMSAKQYPEIRPRFQFISNYLRAGMADWLTYTPGEKSAFFARFPIWSGLAGFGTTFDTGYYQDIHFHHGYYLSTGAYLGLIDSTFLSQYGLMLKLVAKHFANWNRADSDFPYFRSFDLWNGHTFATAPGWSPLGNNQESLSECLNAWTGIFFLGELMGDTAMRDAGAMGYAIESAAAKLYWYDKTATTHPSQFRNTYKMSSIVWSSGITYTTWFGRDPEFMHGIQWWPTYTMSYFHVDDPVYAQAEWDEFWSRQTAQPGGSALYGRPMYNGTLIGGMVTGYHFRPWYHYILRHYSMINPDNAAAIFDYWMTQQQWTGAAFNSVPVDWLNFFPGQSAITYYWIHANRHLGKKDFTVWSDPPTSATFVRNGTNTFCAYNMGSTPRTFIFYKNGSYLGSLDNVRPFSMTNSRVLGSTTVVTQTNSTPNVPLPQEEGITVLDPKISQINNKLQVEIRLKQQSQVLLRLYTKDGLMMQIFMDEVLDPGLYLKEWEVNVGTGIYFLKKQIGKKVDWELVTVKK